MAKLLHGLLCFLVLPRVQFQDLCFSWYINDLKKTFHQLPNYLLMILLSFLLSMIHDTNVSADQMNKDLKKILMQAYQWKMSINPDISKQAQEITFSKKNIARSFRIPFFTLIKLLHLQYSLGVFLNKKLNFQHHTKEKIAKASKRIGVICIKKLNNEKHFIS